MSGQILTAHDVDEQSEVPRHKAGTYLRDWMGRLWVYLQASEALVQGNAVEAASYASINADVDAAAAADTIRVTGTGDFTQTALPDLAGDGQITAFSGNYDQNGHTYWLWVDAGASQGQGGPIIKRVSNNAVDVYWVNSNDGKIATALTTSSDYIVFTLTRVQKATASTDLVLGFVQRQGGITDEYWFWALAEGMGVAYIDTSDTAITAGRAIIVGTADGYIQGVNTATPVAVDGQQMAGWGILDQDADGLVPIIAKCPVICMPTAPSRTTVAYPGM